MIRMIRMMLTLTMAESTRGVLPTAGTGSQHKKSCCYREETLRDGDDDDAVGDDDVGDDDDDGDSDNDVTPLKNLGNLALVFEL